MNGLEWAQLVATGAVILLAVAIILLQMDIRSRLVDLDEGVDGLSEQLGYQLAQRPRGKRNRERGMVDTHRNSEGGASNAPGGGTMGQSFGLPGGTHPYETGWPAGFTRDQRVSMEPRPPMA